MSHPSKADQLRTLLAQPQCHIMPCAFDALSARMIEDAGFPVSFMSGFGVSASRIGMPDVGYMSYGDMVAVGRDICAASPSIPIIGDGDTGYGNAMNVKQTVRGYAQAGFAGIMIEDQQAPKRCGHTKGKAVVNRAEAIGRVKAAVDAREEGADILIMARTDARHAHGLDEALERAQAFKDAGADILFVEAPRSVEELQEIGRAVPHLHMANMLEGGHTPILSADQLYQYGFCLAAYPLTLLSAAAKAMQAALACLKSDQPADELILDFESLKECVGFNRYYREEERYGALTDSNASPL